LQFLKNDSIVLEKPLEFPRQVFDFGSSIEPQLLIAMQCLYEGLLQSFVNLGLALGATPIAVTNCIAGWETLDTFYDSVLVSCYSDTALRLVLVGDELELCCEQSPPNKKPPSEPDLPPPNIPPGTPLVETEFPYSPPYDEGTDAGLSIPFPGDYEPPEPPSSNYRVAVDVFAGSTYVDTGYTKTITATSVPTIVSVQVSGSNLAVVTVFVEGEGNVLLGPTAYNSVCDFGFGTSMGAFLASTARVEVSPCSP
jgi:hypothetical protein